MCKLAVAHGIWFCLTRMGKVRGFFFRAGLPVLLLTVALGFSSWNRAVAADDSANARPYRLVAGDTIRSVLLRTNCVRSMEEYSRLREAFARLNPGLEYSQKLIPGRMVRVPWDGSSDRRGCLTPALARIVRVEHESFSTMEKVRVFLDGPVLPDVFMLKEPLPWRLVCDFDESLPRPGLERVIDCGGRLVSRVRIGHETAPFRRARVVMDVADSLVGRVEQVFFERDSVFEIIVHESFDEK